MKDKEALARIKINKLLEEACWRLLDEHNLRKNVLSEATVRGAQRTTNADYLLLDDYYRPIAIIEAKAPDKNPLVGKEQARNYALEMQARFVFLSG